MDQKKNLPIKKFYNYPFAFEVILFSFNVYVYNMNSFTKVQVVHVTLRINFFEI